MEQNPLNERLEQLAKLVGQALAKRWMAVLSQRQRAQVRADQRASPESAKS